MGVVDHHQTSQFGVGQTTPEAYEGSSTTFKAKLKKKKFLSVLPLVAEQFPWFIGVVRLPKGKTQILFS
jgi:hypothetical protein